MQNNKSQDNDWFRLESNKEGTRWFGKCWFVHELLKYEFNVEFDVSLWSLMRVRGVFIRVYCEVLCKFIAEFDVSLLWYLMQVHYGVLFESIVKFDLSFLWSLM